MPITQEQIQAMKGRMKNRPPAGVNQSFIKNIDYDPNDSESKRYVPSGEQVTEVIKPSEAPQVDKTEAISAVGTPEGIKGAFGAEWRPADIFRERGLTERGITGAVQLPGSPDIFTIGEKGKWIETPEEYEELFGTRETKGIVGQITPEQAKLLGVRPEGVAELKAGRIEEAGKKELYNLAQQAGLTWEETMNLVSAQYPTDTTEIRDELGISDIVGELFKKPDKTTQEIYQEAYQKSDLPDLKNKIKNIDDKIASKESDLVKATGELNMNPWISQATRTGRLRILNELASADINNLNKQRNSYLDVYDKEIDELEGVMLRGEEQYKEQRILKAEQLNYLLEEAERRTTEEEKARVAEGLRYMPDWLKDRAKEEEAEDTQVIKLPDGSQVLINKNTGEIIKTYGTDDVEILTAEGMYPEDISFNYNEKLDINKIPKLGGKQITNKTARGANLPYGITDKQADWIIDHRLGNIQFQQLKSKDVKSMNDLVELREDINEIRVLKEKVNTGPIAAKAGRAKRYVGWEESSFNQLEIKSGKQLADFIKEISGAAVSEQEAQRLAKLVPNIDMQDGQFIDSLNDLEDGLNGLIEAKIIQFDLENEDELIRAIRGDKEGEIPTGEEDPLQLFGAGERKIITVQGRKLYADTGQPVEGDFSTVKTGMRTDRHNNPTAFTTDIAKMALKKGVDYTEGDPFPNNPKLKTARLLGDPVKQTIKVIDKIGFYTSGGKKRWTHTAMSTANWNKMSYAEKKNVIKKMYQKEGNKGILNNYFA